MLNFYFSTFELITRGWKIKGFISSYYLEAEKLKVLLRDTNSMGKLLFYHFRVTSSWLKNKKFHFALLTQNWKKESSTSSY